MVIEQTILFTVMPRGISIDSGDSLPVSIFVAPRLEGADKLVAFPDWLQWTQKLKDGGIDLDLKCGSRTLVVSIDDHRESLRPDLWEQLFKEDTLVRSYNVYPTIDEYSERGIISFEIRQALSAIKAIYQEASVTLALPDSSRPGDKRFADTNRSRLQGLVEKLQANWRDGEDGQDISALRDQVRVTKDTVDTFLRSKRRMTGPLDREGLIVSKPDSGALKDIARAFSVFHHMPTPGYEDPPISDALDVDNLLDFHQALSALNSYPDLLRVLGLVFDLDLPRAFVEETPRGTFGTISVTNATPRLGWALHPKIPLLATAYVHMQTDSQKFFFAAPRIMSDPEAPVTVIGLLSLDPAKFGLAQVDVDGGMHKNIMLAETLTPPTSYSHNTDPNARPEPAPHPEVFDPGATLPSLRSGGLSLFADKRALQFLDSMLQSKAFNDDLKSGGGDADQVRPFFAEHLIRGYRLDVWDSRTKLWHSLHMRNAEYQVGDVPFVPETRPEEGFVQLAATQPAKGSTPITHDLYLHEAIARWAGWSLSAPMPSRHLSRHPKAGDALPRDQDPPLDFSEDQPVTPFKVAARYKVVPNSLPQLRFGVRYRMRARAVDLAGNSLQVNDKLAEVLAAALALPIDPEGFTYTRFEPVPAPLLILRDVKGVTGSGSAIDRIVIRTFNSDISKDAIPVDTTAADRHIVPPRTSVEMAERLGMFDDPNGKLKADAATWQLIWDRDAGEFKDTEQEIDVAGKVGKYPLEPADRIDLLPYLPDLLSRGAAIRDLPGTPSGAIGKAMPNLGAAESVTYKMLSDPNPRAGSATMISFGEAGDWQKILGFRLTLDEPKPSQKDVSPNWDPAKRLLTVYLPKGQTKVVPLTSFTNLDDLKLMGVWQWLREYIEHITVDDPQPQFLLPGADVDRIAHVLQRAVEGGHWMLTPPRMLTLIHAVQQPIGRPEFVASNVEREDDDEASSSAIPLDSSESPEPLETAAYRSRTDPTELAPITAWRRMGATDAYLHGALKVHGASTAKLDLTANWDDPIDFPSQLKKPPSIIHQEGPVDELPLPSVNEEVYLYVSAKDSIYGRRVGYYDPEHDRIVFVRTGDSTGTKDRNPKYFYNALPRHHLNDTKRHIISYTAIATSRFREYFPESLKPEEFIRSSEPIIVDVPASARPLSPDVVYVVPTFGWQRQIDTNMKRSVRFGGGLRIYLNRPWFSSGEGELLGVALWSNNAYGTIDNQTRDKFMPFITQWGMDPIWQTGSLSKVPAIVNFPDAVEHDTNVSLEESSARDEEKNSGLVNVVGFKPEFDEARELWYADLTVNTNTQTYMPFVRLALVRYQPHALADAKISRVVLADFAQLTPDRSATVTADPHHPRSLQVVITGVAPRGPQAMVNGEPRPTAVTSRPTQIQIRVQNRDPSLKSDLAWIDVTPDVAQVKNYFDGFVADRDLIMWAGNIEFAKLPHPGEFRLLIEEHEYISADYSLPEGRTIGQPSRLIYAETFELDDALVSET